MGIRRGQVVLYSNNEKGDTPIQKADNRPAVVVSNNSCNNFSPVITIVPLTSKKTHKMMPTHAFVDRETGLNVALCEQVISVVKKDVIPTSGFVTEKELNDIELSLMVQMGLMKQKPIETAGENEPPAEQTDEPCEESKPKERIDNGLLDMAKETLKANMKFLCELSKRIDEINKN